MSTEDEVHGGSIVQCCLDVVAIAYLPFEGLTVNECPAHGLWPERRVYARNVDWMAGCARRSTAHSLGTNQTTHLTLLRHAHNCDSVCDAHLLTITLGL